MSLIVQKFGGATLADPTKIKAAARRISELKKQGKSVIAVVSAMGKTTNSLIDLAFQVSPQPLRRELDMLLSTGERVSMALMSMALNDLGCPAISFTGSQAGVLTDDAHQNALIIDVKPQRVQEALDKQQVVVLAGFQGVSPKTKEITTLGRGGSDTTAVAMAAALNAERCEILKDVSGVFTADPQLIKTARPIHRLSYSQLQDMTFWGAKVLHYRSAELAKLRQVPLYIGPAHSYSEGTLVLEEGDMFESTKIISLNSHENVVQVCATNTDKAKTLSQLIEFLSTNQIPSPQILKVENNSKGSQIFLTGPQEVVSSIKKSLQNHNNFILDQKDLSSITATCTGSASPEIALNILNRLASKKIEVHSALFGAMSLTCFIDKKQREVALSTLHDLAT